jgi:hypothetical protein
MIRNGRTITLGEEFVRELEAAKQYVGRNAPRRGRQFVSEVMDFSLEILAPLRLLIQPILILPHPATNYGGQSFASNTSSCTRLARQKYASSSSITVAATAPI